MTQRNVATWVLGIIVAVSIGGGVAAQLLPGEKVQVINVRKDALRVIPTCKELGRCKGEQHLLLKSVNPRAIGRMKRKGCQVGHELDDETELRCPEGRTYLGVRQERFFWSHDVFSASQVGALAIHAKGVTGNGVKIAILDSGVDIDHPELAGKIFAYRNFTENGPEDAIGHGTHVAGIAMGRGVQEIDDDGRTNRVIGIGPDAQIIVAKVCGDDGWCPEGAVLAGVEWAVEQGADVMNLSLGGGAFLDHCDGDPLAAKLNWAAGQGVVVVAASGNGGEGGEGVAVPACGSKVLAVGAVDENDVVQLWSGYGRPLDLVAPGVGILSTLSCLSVATCPEAAYGKASGTSMASPHVAGAAALLLHADPTLTPPQVYSVLTETAKDLGGAGYDTRHGFGRVNAEAAVSLMSDRDRDGFSVPEDCNDSDALIYPGRGEICNGKDDNCDGRIDEGWDQDGDTVTSCGGDCNDADPLISPKAQETCNGKDENCNAIVDENCPVGGRGAGSASSARSSTPSDSTRRGDHGQEQQEDRVGARIRAEVEIRNAKEAYVRAWTKVEMEVRAGKVVHDEAKLLLSDAYDLLLKAEDAFLGGDVNDAWSLAQEAKRKANQAQSGHYFRDAPHSAEASRGEKDSKGDDDLSERSGREEPRGDDNDDDDDDDDRPSGSVGVRGEAGAGLGVNGLKAKGELKVGVEVGIGKSKGKGKRH